METASKAEEKDATMEEVPTKVGYTRLISMNKIYTLIDELVKEISVDHASKKYKDFNIAFSNWYTKSNKATTTKMKVQKARLAKWVQWQYLQLSNRKVKATFHKEWFGMYGTKNYDLVLAQTVLLLPTETK